MSAHRFLFYAPSFEAGAGAVELSGEEHHHLSRVLRIGPGQEAFVTNGRGVIARCRVGGVDSESTTLSIAGTETVARGREVTLALALIKKDRFEQALEQCVELGIARCVPFVAERGQVPVYNEASMERLHRVMVSAMKQSFGAWLPDLSAPARFADMVSRCGSDAVLVVGSPDGPALKPMDGPVAVVVGPEAGLSDAELEELRSAYAVFASISRRRLRSETAAVALSAAVLQPD